MKQLFLRTGPSHHPTGAGTLNGGRNASFKPPPNLLLLLLSILAVCVFIFWKLKFGYQKEALTVEKIEEFLTPKELEAYQAAQKEVDDKFENCIQYILYALADGKYVCLSCPNSIPFVTLKEGEIWYIGHTCQNDEVRHSKSFRQKHNVWMFTNYVGRKEECHRIELKLIRGYKYLPESQKPETKLFIPPYNQTDKN